MGRLSSLICKHTVIIFSLAAGLSAWSGLSQASSPNKALVLLERMSESLQEKSYQGTFVFRRGEELSAMRVTHTADNEGEREVIVTLTGQEREMVRSNRRFGVFSGGEGLSAKLLGNVEKNYELSLLGLDRVAGRYASLVKVAPRDIYRYGYRLWVDNASGLLLKSELLDDDRILEQVMFTSIELLPEDEGGSPPEASEPQVKDDQAAPKMSDSSWSVTDLPEGFVLSNLRRADKDNGVEHLVFTDGLASVSVFIESAERPENSFVGYSRLGAVNAFGAIVSGHQVTVVGEVPKAAVRRIGASLQHNQ